jgi:hypothetical protein
VVGAAQAAAGTDREGHRYPDLMLVELGPVPSSSAIAYVAFCRERLAELQADPDQVAPTLTPELVARFQGLLDLWEEIAESGPVFSWELEVDVEEVEYDFVAFVRVVLGGDQIGRTSESAADQQAELRRPFRVALVNGILTALEREGPSSAGLAAELRVQWPDDDIT